MRRIALRPSGYNAYLGPRCGSALVRSQPAHWSPPIDTHDTLRSPHKGKRGLRRLINALSYSLSGLGLAFRHESAFRQEVALAAVLLPLALFVPVSAAERVLLIASVLLLLIVELLNSSIEAAVDRIGLDAHHLSKRAKDVGSAAVLVALVLLATTWGLIALPVLVQWALALAA